jgi:hypothetical protein
MKQQGFYLGSYAALAANHSHLQEQEFFEGLARLPFISGLEIPYHALPTEGFHRFGFEWFAAALPKNTRLIVTLLPGQMQSLQGGEAKPADPQFGLASSDGSGRERALDFAGRAIRATEKLLSFRPDLIWQALEVHSGPRRLSSATTEGPQPSAQALERSLSFLRAELPRNVLLTLEHCDAYREGQPPEKGFLTIEEELHALDAVAAQASGDVGVVINWGRSAIEARRSEEPLRHLLQAKASGLLRGVMFSGATEAHPLYGAWKDTHAPIAEAEGDQSLLLTEARIHDALKVVGPDVFVGLKIQPLPLTLGTSERLQFLERNLRSLAKAAGVK